MSPFLKPSRIAFCGIVFCILTGAINLDIIFYNMKTLLEKILARLAKAIVRKYSPKIVGITGSMGKTSAKEAIYAVLKNKFCVRRNIKNYNNEIGVPLTVIGSESGGRSIRGWVAVFLKAMKLILMTANDYPEILILEMGADKPGDIEYLVNYFPCFAGVVTKIGPAHLEAFKTVENIAREKQKIVTHLNKDGFAILNYDDPLVREMHKRVKAKVIFFGYHDEAMVRSIDLAQQGEGLDLSGIKFKIAYGGSAVPVFLPGVVGAHQINSALAAVAVGIAFGMNLIEISEGLKDYKTPKGRMNLIEGRNTLIIDDTYNSSPRAASAALETLAKLNIKQVKRKVAILGDMLELGDYTDEAHYALGRKAVEAGVDRLICVGKNRAKIAEGARTGGLASEQIVEYLDSASALEKINSIISAEDLILIKGSQGARMERIVKALMKDPARAPELLVRHGIGWENKN